MESLAARTGIIRDMWLLNDRWPDTRAFASMAHGIFKFFSAQSEEQKGDRRLRLGLPGDATRECHLRGTNGRHGLQPRARADVPRATATTSATASAG